MKRSLIAGAVIALVIIGIGWGLFSRSAAPEAPPTAAYNPSLSSTVAEPSNTAAAPSPEPPVREAPVPEPAPVIPPDEKVALSRPPAAAPSPQPSAPTGPPPTRSVPTPSLPTPRVARPAPSLRPDPPVAPTFLADEVLTSQASIAFNAPDQIPLRERRVIQLLLDPRQTMPELLGAQIREPGRVETARIRIAESVEAQLSGDAFEIRPVTPEVQALSAESSTEWKWEVQPREPGTHRLFLTINAIIESTAVKRTIRTFDHEILVVVPPVAAGKTAAPSIRWVPWIVLAALVLLLLGARLRRRRSPPASYDLPTMRLDEDSTGRLEPGQVIAGRYEIERPLGRGGMGIVYAARDREFNGERVAVKTILPHAATGSRAIERFRREIQYARKVSHPNVCRIFDVGRDGARMFVTMELVEGITLSDHIRAHGPMREDEALPIVRQIAAGLDETHRLGLVHRDLKTGNIMLAANGRAVLMDFGLACLITTPAPAESLTQTGAVVGSPMYMAPEQFEGGEVSPATDIYALGTVLYEMLTAALPFEGNTPVSVIAKRLSEPPIPPSRRLPSISVRVEAVILKCLARHPEERFQRAPDLVRSLESVVSTSA